MMEKISIQDIANVLVEKNGMKKKDADQFVMAIFEVVKEGLKQDKLVKIKGFGTFKIIDIEARESVNVNTGERVLIEGHDKITFTPDAAMKELVNRPFSQFETVLLNEGVEFDDADFDEIPEPAVDDEEPPVEEEEVPVVEKPAPIVKEPEAAAEEPTPVIEESEPAAEEPATAIEEPEPAAEEEVSAVEESVEPTYYLSEEDNARTVSLKTCLLSVILACLVGGVAGYFFRALTETPTLIVEPADEIVEEKTPEKEDGQKPDSTKKQTIQAAPSQEDASKKPVPQPQAGKQDENQKKDKADEAKAKADEVKADEAKARAENTSKDYDKMDARVHLGAYRIIGVSYVVKAKAGDTTAKIARRTLGPDMECYIEVLNGIKGSTPLQEGQDIKIPKIELKKKKQKKIEQ